MKFQFAFILVTVLVGSQAVWAQTDNKNNEEGGQPSSLQPYYPEKSKETQKIKRKKSTRKVTYDARDKFYDRIEQVAKNNRKAEKELQKPQYSDPSYFGHKKQPKRRSAGKLKYCKECGIRH